MIRLGVIGYGGRIQGVIDLIDRLGHGTKVVALCDIKNKEIKKRMRDGGKNPDEVRFYDDADSLLKNKILDAILVGTRCSLHTKMGTKVLKKNLPMYLEKPVATTMADLLTLRNAAAKSTSEVVVSFPLRMTPLVRMAKEIIDSGKIGTVEHVQAWNNVPYGACYFQDWYRDENETQGLFLQKATHDFDYINYLLGTRPVMICAMNSKRIYKGDRPAGLKCNDCKEWESCLESPFHEHYTKCQTAQVGPNRLMCGFAKDTGNEDSGSALIMYESGMHVCYSQNFFARRKAAKRGATLLGYKGTLEFDWYTDEIKVVMHHSPRIETYKMDTAAASHGGGDTVLAENFVRVIQGKEKSVSPLKAGLLSVLMCLKAKESAETKTFKAIEYPDGVTVDCDIY